MTREEVYARLKDVFADVFDHEVELTDTTTANDVAGWDSFAHITLMGAIEDEFSIKFSIQEVVTFKRIGDIVTKIIEMCNK